MCLAYKIVAPLISAHGIGPGLFQGSGLGCRVQGLKTLTPNPKLGFGVPYFNTFFSLKEPL